MKKIINILILFCVVSSSNAKSNDILVVDKIRVFDSVLVFSNTIHYGCHTVDKITSQDKIMFYLAQLYAINPTKEKYKVQIICEADNGEIVIDSTVNKWIEDEPQKVGDNTLKAFEQSLGLDPKPGALVQGQKTPLKNGHTYYIKLIVEDQLLGITSFSYNTNEK